MVSEPHHPRLTIHQGTDEEESLSLPHQLSPSSTRAVSPLAWISCDRYMLVYTIISFLGAGILWPYNTLVSVPDYFNLLFPSAKLEFVIPAVLNYPGLILLIVMVKHGNKVSFRNRIIACFVVFAVVALAIPIVGNLMQRETPAQSHAALAVVLLLIFSAGLFTAVLQSTLFGFTSAFPSLYTQALMGGSGFSGLFVTLIRVFTKLGYPETDEGTIRSSTVYFAISAGFSVLCLALFLAMERIPFARQYLDRQKRFEQAALASKSDDFEEEVESLLEDTGKSGEEQVEFQVVDFKSVFQRIWKNGLVVFGVFTCTFLIFPGVIAELRPSAGSSFSADWYTLILFVEFNFFDVVGRSLPSYILLFSKNTLWMASLSRFALYPLFLLKAKHIILTADLWSFLLMAMFAVSNGYIASLGMMYGPTYVEKDYEKETAGFIMSCFLTFGIFAGSNIALLMQYIGIGV